MFTKFFKPFIIIALIIAALSLFTLNVYAAPDTTDAVNYTVPARPDGVQCQDFGPIAGLRIIAQPAGPMYFMDHGSIDTPFNHASAFTAYGYDNDGAPNTPLAFLSSGNVVASVNFKTGNNEWTAGGLAVPAEVDHIRATAPKTKGSTWFCFVDASAPTVTPTLAPTTTPTQTTTSTPTVTSTPVASITPPAATETATPVPPTATPTPAPVSNTDLTVNVTALDSAPTCLDEAPEPTPGIHAAGVACSDGVLFIGEGKVITATVRVLNAGPDVAAGAAVTVTVNGLVKVVHLGDMVAGAAVRLDVPVKVMAGTNTVMATVKAQTTERDTTNNTATAIFDGYGCVDGAVNVGGDAVGGLDGVCAASGWAVYMPVVRR